VPAWRGGGVAVYTTGTTLLTIYRFEKSESRGRSWTALDRFSPDTFGGTID
jgi:hypothetical protein